MNSAANTAVTPTPNPRRNTLPGAVLWDMDGTIVDTEPYWIEAETALITSHAGTWTTEQAHQLVGNNLLDSAEILIRQGVRMPAEEIIDHLVAEVERRAQVEVPWRPGARELLAELTAAGIPNVLVTMSYRSLARAVAAHLPAGTFAHLVAGDDVARGKPHPEPYLRAAELIGLPPGECVAIEDSPSGVRSAAAAGVPVVAVEYLVPLGQIAPAPVVHTLDGVRPADLLSLAG